MARERARTTVFLPDARVIGLIRLIHARGPLADGSLNKTHPSRTTSPLHVYDADPLFTTNLEEPVRRMFTGAGAAVPPRSA